MMPHFAQVLESCGVRGWEDGHQTLTIDRAGFSRLLRDLLDRLPFDEDWYLATYADVRHAVAEGRLTSARQHYLEFGYFEGRLPGLAGFAAEAYLDRYPDLAPLRDGADVRQAALDHFVRYGYREGRNPKGHTVP